MMDLMERLAQFHEGFYSSNDIAKKLMELSGLEDNRTLGEELLEAMYQIRAMAANPYNKDCWRILYNVLLYISGAEHF